MMSADELRREIDAQKPTKEALDIILGIVKREIESCAKYGKDNFKLFFFDEGNEELKNCRYALYAGSREYDEYVKHGGNVRCKNIAEVLLPLGYSMEEYHGNYGRSRTRSVIVTWKRRI